MISADESLQLTFDGSHLRSTHSCESVEENRCASARPKAGPKAHLVLARAPDVGEEDVELLGGPH